MMNLICSIPENVGWAMVGAAMMLCAMLLYKLGKMIVDCVREYIEEEKKERESEGKE